MFRFAFIHTHLYIIILTISHGPIYFQSLNINIYNKKDSDLYLQKIFFFFAQSPFTLSVTIDIFSGLEN